MFPSTTPVSRLPNKLAKSGRSVMEYLPRLDAIKHGDEKVGSDVPDRAQEGKEVNEALTELSRWLALQPVEQKQEYGRRERLHDGSEESFNFLNKGIRYSQWQEFVQRLDQLKRVDIVHFASDEPLEDAEQSFDLPVGRDDRCAAHKQSLPYSCQCRNVAALFPQGGGEERSK